MEVHFLALASPLLKPKTLAEAVSCLAEHFSQMAQDFGQRRG